MARVTITMEDVSAGGDVSFAAEFSGMEEGSDAATPAMLMSMASRAMFENGMTAEAMNVGMQAINEGKVPSECILDHFTKKKISEIDPR